MAQSQNPRLHPLGIGDPDGPVEALIVILFGEDGAAGAADLAGQWSPMVPRGVFLGLDLDLGGRRLDLVAVRGLIGEAANRRGLRDRQVVMLGAGRAGQLAIDLVLLGAVPGASVITLDIPLEATPTTLTPPPAAVRLVQHRTPDDPDGQRFRAVVEALQRRRINTHSMLLPRREAATQRAALRAAGAFLAELVANAGRLDGDPERWP